MRAKSYFWDALVSAVRLVDTAQTIERKSHHASVGGGGLDVVGEGKTVE